MGGISFIAYGVGDQYNIGMVPVSGTIPCTDYDCHYFWFIACKVQKDYFSAVGAIVFLIDVFDRDSACSIASFNLNICTLLVY